MKLSLIAYRCIEGNLVDKLIGWYTAPFRSKFNGEWKEGYSHTELLFVSKQLMFSASQWENRVRFKHKSGIGPHWDVVKEYEVSDEEAEVVFTQCTELVGAEYDWVGVLGFVLPFVEDGANKWFCSEICAHVLVDSGLLDAKGMDYADICPNSLVKLV